MKDEIKEILDYLNIKGKKMIGIKQKELLLDYITNLQEENESLHTRIKTIKRRRKEQTAKIRKYREEITNKQNSNKDYKQRIDKAIEYIKKHCDYGYAGQKCLTDVLYRYEAEELLEILQGSDE